MFFPKTFFGNTNPLPLVCAFCGCQTEIWSPSDQQLGDLIDASYLISLQRELLRLQRTQVLFDRFPASRHPVKVDKFYAGNSRDQDTEEDADFEAALQSDPELMEFLRPASGERSFYLPARLSWVTQRVAYLKNAVAQSSIRCGSCQEGFLRIKHSWFEE